MKTASTGVVMASDGGTYRSTLGGPASIVASAAGASLTAALASAAANAKPGSNASIRGGSSEKQEAGKGQEQEQRVGRQKISTSDIQLVQNLIERCLQLYMPQKDVAATLQQQAKIEPGFTNLVWEKLEEQNPDFFKAYYLRLQVKDQIVMFNYLLEQQVMMVQRLQMGWMQNMSMMGRPGMPPMPAPGMQGINPPGMGVPNFPPTSGLEGFPMVPISGMGAGASGASGLPSSNREGAVGTSQMPGGMGGAGTQDQSSVPLHRGSSSEMHLLGDAGEDLLGFGDGLDTLGERSQSRRRSQQHHVPQQPHGSDNHFNMSPGDVLPNLPKNFSFSDFGNFDLHLGGIHGSGGQTLSDFHLADIEGDRLMMMPTSRADGSSPPEPMVAEGSAGRLSIQAQEPGISGGSCSQDHAAVMMPAANNTGGDSDDGLGSDHMVGAHGRHEDEEHSMLMLSGIDDPGDCLGGDGIPRNFSFGDMVPIDFGALGDHGTDQHHQ